MNMNWTITISFVIVASLSLIPVRLAMATVFDSSGEAVGGETPFFRPQPPAQITSPDNFLQLPPPSSSAPSEGGGAVTDPGLQQQQQQPQQQQSDPEQGSRPEDEEEENDEEDDEDNDNNVVFSLADTPERVCAGFNQLSNKDKLEMIFTLVPNDRQVLLDKLSTCSSIIIQED
jgi:hypothetical protein